jgi:OOP family OmpA-OmpF porin
MPEIPDIHRLCGEWIDRVGVDALFEQWSFPRPPVCPFVVVASEDSRMRQYPLIAIALIGLSGGSALAQGQQTPRGFYVGAALGANMPSDASLTGVGIMNDTRYETAPLGTISIGYAYGSGLRAELEAGLRRNDVDRVSGTGASGGSGAIRSYGAMLNVLFDIDTGTPVTPYVGAGLGWAFLEAQDVRSLNGGRAMDGTDNRFAYQGILGLSYGLSTDVTLTLDYRYFATLDPRFDARATGGTATAVDGAYAAHAVMMGLRYQFQGPAAAQPQAQIAAPTPPAIPAVEAPRSFLVFFDFDKSAITSEAASIIVQAAEHARRGGVARLVVTGHADTSGPTAYNQRLSERRAAAVRDALVRQGLAPSTISTVGRGETDPRVKTGDGVREPQNRRAEIVLR